MSHLSFGSTFCRVLTGLLVSTSICAEEVAPQSAVLEEIVVTATRAETNLQQTSVAVSAFSSEALDNRNISSLLHISDYVPSLSIGSRSGTSAANGAVAIRGMGIDATASSAAVGIYVDEVYFASGPGNLLDLYDVRRIEVLRGPQGTVFGRNTIAGAIQYITNEPEPEWGGYLSAVGGSDSRRDVKGALNIPVSENFALRIAGALTDRDGYVEDLFRDTDRGGEETEAVRLRAQWTPTGRLTVDLKGERINHETNGRAVLVSEVNPNAQFVGLARLFGETRPLDDRYLSPGDYTSAGFNAPDYFDFNYSILQGAIQYDLSEWLSLKSITSYSEYESRLAQDFDNTPLSIISALPSHDDTEVFTQELQLNGSSASASISWTAGLYYYDSERRELPGQAIVLGFAPPAHPFGDPATDIQSSAIYGRLIYGLTERTSLIAGLRYTREETEAWLIDQTEPVSETFKSTSPHIGLEFKANEEMMLYAKASRGFRAGGITPNAALPGGGLAFDPETAWTYEVGARLELLDRRLRVNPTLFYTDWEDIQFNVLIPTPATIVAATRNAGDAEIRGFELETQFAATDRLQFTGVASLLEAEYTRVEDLIKFIYPQGFPGPVETVPNISKDSELQRAPEAKFALGAHYTHPLGRGGDVSASLNYAWTDEQSSAVTIADAITMPDYGLLNARIQYNSPDRHWSLAVFGTNLTDEFYLIGGVDFAGGYTTGTKELDVARGREFGVELRIGF